MFPFAGYDPPEPESSPVQARLEQVRGESGSSAGALSSKLQLSY